MRRHESPEDKKRKLQKEIRGEGGGIKNILLGDPASDLPLLIVRGAYS